jgi:hypothetical protein
LVQSLACARTLNFYLTPDFIYLFILNKAYINSRTFFGGKVIP